ncbi:MAG: glycoside hydrolase family 1 protein [Firmicutes bacterium]|nr:glycoside hydrolase family 1 protein [Bacillota bacterium]
MAENGLVATYVLWEGLDLTVLKFPPGFLWGSATSAFQVEGGSQNHDFYDWALKGRVKDGTRPDEAVDFWHRYPEDIALMKEMHHNAARIGLEWARIQPEVGTFDQSALEHYRKILTALREAGIEPVVTLHHFANPMWFVKRGGWEAQNAPEHFLRYVGEAISCLADLVTWWVTINEPNVYTTYAYFQGIFPPGKRSFFAAQKVRKHLLLAHREAYRFIHNHYRIRGFSEPKVSVAMHLRTFDSARKTSPLDKLAVKMLHRLFHLQFLDPIADSLDYLGLQYYSGDLVRFPLRTLNRPGLPKNALGWDIYPEGFYRVLTWAWQRYRLPILVTENGTCDEADELRPSFLIQHLLQLHKAIKQGVTVLGYLHWSTLDNFELVEGLSRRFGLIYVDHTDPAKPRRIKESGRLFGQIARENGLVISEFDETSESSGSTPER